MAFGTKKSVVATPSFSERMASIKSMFKTAHENASNLHAERVLRGYKIQFESRDGRYNCIDMDIQQTDKESGVRPVNINTIKYLIFGGVKYVVE